MYAALSAANEAILRAKSPEELFRSACEIAVETGGFLLGTVFTLDRASGRWRASRRAGRWRRSRRRAAVDRPGSSPAARA